MIFPLEKFKTIETPFYYYDTIVLEETLNSILGFAKKYAYHLHYAVKTNSNPRILSIIAARGLGADCVSGGEINAALDAGFPANKIVFAGVGKADWEINLALKNNIYCFNVESIPELRVIDELAKNQGKIASVALRINPEVDAKTHHYITTGLKENKFGINLSQLSEVLDCCEQLKNINLIGLHFHIGSQIRDMASFENLSVKVGEIQEGINKRGIDLKVINFGGGLGVNYENPEQEMIPDFATYFALFNTNFKAKAGQEIHFEPGRSVAAQCGSLVSKVLYVKEGSHKKFIILDAGFTELIRPALYGALHKIENISSTSKDMDEYDVVGPICESSDSFAKSLQLNLTKRGDIIAIRTAGAYGEVMASQYNCRQLPKSYFSDLL